MKYLSLVLIVLVVACKSSKPPIPVNTMKQIMFDMTIADEYYVNKLGSDTNFNKQSPQPTAFYKEVFAKHKISQKEFYIALSFYQNNPEVMRELLDSIVNLSSKNKQFLDSNFLKTRNIKP